MGMTESLVLPADVDLFSVADLPEDARRGIDSSEGSFALSRPRSRRGSKVLTADAAELVRLFRTPRTIVEAIIDFSRSRAIDPEEALERSYPLLDDLVRSEYLVP